MRRRIGSFRIHRDFLEAGNKPDLRMIFANVIVLEARHDYSRQCVEYIATSDLFEPLEDHCRAPEYEIIFTREDGKLLMVAKKRYDAPPLRSGFRQKILNLKIALNAFLP